MPIDDTIHVLDIDSGKTIWTGQPIKPRRAGEFRGLSGADMLAFSPDGKLLASGGCDRTVRVWDAASGKELRRFVGHKDDITALAFSPDSKTLASGSADTNVLLWSVWKE